MNFENISNIKPISGRGHGGKNALNLPESKELIKLLASINNLDEAYVNLVSSKWDSVNLLKRFKNLIILRSLTKDYALTALRLGYSMASKEITHFL